MRSKQPRTVEILKIIGRGDFPPFIGLFHRHFQKALPTVSNTMRVTLVAPVDLLDLIVPDKMLDQIESIEIQYDRGGPGDTIN